jgi:hypothetical protein
VYSPFLPTIQYYTQVYEGVVEQEIAQAEADEDSAARLVQTLSVGLGGGAVLCGLGIALLVTHSLTRLYQQIEEKNVTLTEANARLQALATTDPLTGLPNHRALIAAIEQELKRSERYSRLGVITFFRTIFPAHIIGTVFQSGSEIVSPLATLIAWLRVIPATLGTAAV